MSDTTKTNDTEPKTEDQVQQQEPTDNNPEPQPSDEPQQSAVSKAIDELGIGPEVRQRMMPRETMQNKPALSRTVLQTIKEIRSQKNLRRMSLTRRTNRKKSRPKKSFLSASRASAAVSVWGNFLLKAVRRVKLCRPCNAR